jgi:hypothetical protein
VVLPGRKRAESVFLSPGLSRQRTVPWWDAEPSLRSGQCPGQRFCCVFAVQRRSCFYVYPSSSWPSIEIEGRSAHPLGERFNPLGLRRRSRQDHVLSRLIICWKNSSCMCRLHPATRRVNACLCAGCFCRQMLLSVATMRCHCRCDFFGRSTLKFLNIMSLSRRFRARSRPPGPVGRGLCTPDPWRHYMVGDRSALRSDARACHPAMA